MDGFDIALGWLKKGMKVRRAEWGTRFITMTWTRLVIIDSELNDWNPTQADILAEDWQIVI